MVPLIHKYLAGDVDPADVKVRQEAMSCFQVSSIFPSFQLDLERSMEVVWLYTQNVSELDFIVC